VFELTTDATAGAPVRHPSGRRVLHVSQATETGVPFVAEDYVRAQLQAGWEVAVACPGGTLASVMRGLGVEVLDWPSQREPDPRTIPREAAALRRVLRAWRPDLVHLHSAKAGLVGRLVLRGRVPTVYTPHAWSWLAAEGRTRRAAQAWERLGTRWSVTCCVSESERAEGREVGLRGDLRLIANDVDVAGLRAGAPADRTQARKLLEVADEDLVVVCCARLAHQKGQDVLLRAWPRVSAALPAARLVLVGSGPLEAALREQARGLEHVRFLGSASRETSVAWMTASDVVACPSRYEGMSLVPLEAGALGRVVVASDFEGVREGGWGGARVVVPVEDAEALADALVTTLEDTDQRSEVEAAAWRLGDELAGQPRAAVQVIRLYDELLGHG
jgi:glycosyltransferase involved in cell wall biosynthesis